MAVKPAFAAIAARIRNASSPVLCTCAPRCAKKVPRGPPAALASALLPITVYRNKIIRLTPRLSAIEDSTPRMVMKRNDQARAPARSEISIICAHVSRRAEMDPAAMVGLINLSQRRLASRSRRVLTHVDLVLGAECGKVFGQPWKVSWAKAEQVQSKDSILLSK